MSRQPIYNRTEEKKIRYLVIDLTKEVKDLLNQKKNHKTFLKEI